MIFVDKVKQLGAVLASPKFCFWVLLPLMFLLIGGTIAQKYVGLYHATETYFSSFYFFIGFMPFPGGYSLILLLAINLLFKLFFYSEWCIRNYGIILTHLGVLLLIIGSMVTAFTQKEGFLYLFPGDEAAFIQDYHEREFVIGVDTALLNRIRHDRIEGGDLLTLDNLPFKIEILMKCDNCAIEEVEESVDDHVIGPAQFMNIKPTDLFLENEENIAGISFVLRDQKERIIAQTSIFEGYNKPVFFDYLGQRYFFTFGRSIRELPFSVKLLEFEKERYLGIDQAKEYSSKILLKDKGISWEANITLNEPVRYKGYTIYQASYDDTQEEIATVLSVVENKGRLFPYISLLICIIGLMLHAILRRSYLSKREVEG